MSDDRESWLNGWRRWESSSLLRMGTGHHCAGCGKWQGDTVCTVFPEGYVEPPEPDWPFNEATCPLCRLRRNAEELDAKLHSGEDKLTARLKALRERQGK